MKSNITRPMAFALALLTNILPAASANQNGTLAGASASEATMLKVFGHSTFSDFLTKVKTPDSARHLTKRGTAPVCQTTAGSPFLSDAQADANSVANLPASWSCTNTHNNGCTIMETSANVQAGICSPTEYLIACDVLPAYLYNIISTCQTGIYGPPQKVAGYQGLNEDTDVYVFINN